jgi:hypothetical protein
MHSNRLPALALLAAAACCSAALAQSPVISQQPANASVPVLTPTSFDVGVEPVDGVTNTFQWRRGGTVIPGATNAYYVVVPCAADNGATFNVSVGILNDTNTAPTLSSSATLTVTEGATTNTIVFIQGASPSTNYNMFAGYITPGKGDDFESQTNGFQGTQSDGYMGRHTEAAPFLNRMVYAFDLSMLPADAIITDVRLSFTGVEYPEDISRDATYDLHLLNGAAVLLSAGERGFNWVNPWTDTNSWGGPYEPAILARIYARGAAANGSRFTFGSNPLLIAAVQAALASPTRSVAFLGKGSDESVNNTTLEIKTDEYRLGDGELPEDQLPSFSVSFTSPTCVSNLAPASAIATQPADVSAGAGSIATFNVVPELADGETASYQWLRNGTEIAGATAAFYATTACVADNGALFSVSVMVVGKRPVLSRAARLTTTAASGETTTLVFQQGVSPSTNYNMFAGYLTPGNRPGEVVLSQTVGFQGDQPDGYMSRFSESAPFLNRMLFAFDLSAVPVGSTIVSASLGFTGEGGADYGAGSSSPGSWDLHLIRPADTAALFAAGEMYYNWVIPWSTNGAGYDPSILSRITTAGGAANDTNHTWTSTAAMVSAVQGALAQRRVAFLAKGTDEMAFGTTMGVKTDDVTDPSLRPTFTLVFRPPDCATTNAPSLRLAVTTTAEGIRLSWEGSGLGVQATTNLVAPAWGGLPGASPLTVPYSGTARYFRLAPL